MVTDGQAADAQGVADAGDPSGRIGDLTIRIDGRHPLSAGSVAAVVAVCDQAEDRGDLSTVVVHVSGAPADPAGPRAVAGLNVALVSRWERVLRRLERLPAATIAVASGDCGGLALDALLATDYRIACPPVRLLVPAGAGATWPGMALYRLVHQSGAAAVRRAVLFGTPIAADEALALRLVDELADNLNVALAAVAELAGGFSGAELAIRRQLMLDAAAVSFDDALGRHLAACDRELRRVSALVTP